MVRYSVRPRDRIFVKRYGFCLLLKLVKIQVKDLSGKYSQKLLDHVKQSATDAFKAASKKEIQETAEATSDLIGNKIAKKITKLSKNLHQNNSGTVTNENDKQIPKELPK